ncbi:MAG: hypothetical protein CVV44_10060 [Spirochaetae bacterium HGW-Spirochaetae-1]|jgi:AcrR family transcriptional regulator|nr:MAG: hypothetical protein CVV44_10060 [Spirochaetae bacterium HGW-Spirochaetae-1]
MAKTSKDKPQKELIMDRSRVLFWEKGYMETSMRDIAQACGFRPANIYNFFTNKEQILFEILIDEMNQIIEPIRHLEHEDDGDPVRQLRLVIENHTRLTLGHRRSSKLLFDMELGSLSPANKKKIIRLRDDYDRIASTIIRRGMERKIFNTADDRMAVYCIASMIVRTRMWYSPDGRLSIDEIIDFIFNFALKGLNFKGR